MRLSDVTQDDVINYLRADEDAPDMALVPAIMDAAKHHISEYTGMGMDELDEHDDVVIAFFLLCEDLYDRRAVQLTGESQVNRTFESMLGKYQKNLI